MLILFIIFTGAFLLFQVQPLIAKLILPVFGGGAAIWTACLLFFQAFLLLGYLYSHLLTKLSTIKQQVMIHFALLAISLVFVPISLARITEHNVVDAPLASILILLMATVGLPYFLLASTGPLVQRWLTYIESNKLPYKLYSFSNVASLIALISYPFLFEPLLVLTDQILFWSLGYVVFVLAFIGLAMKMLKQKNLVMNADNLTDNPIVQSRQKQVSNTKFTNVLWLLLSAVGVVLLVSTTNAMTQNIPPVPFLWILPLCIYLLTFIISFHSPRWYVRWYWFVLFVISSFAAIFMYFIGSGFDIISQILIYSVILFSACMLCHGELARLKPEAEKLTFYYLMMSLGGFLGSAFVAFVAQKVFSQFLEFPLAIFSVYLLFAVCLFFTKKDEEKSHSTIRYLPVASLGFMVVVILFFSYLNALFAQTNVISSRNFYGILTVKDVEINHIIERRLIDGSTSHGTQILTDAGADLTPRSYYRANTGVALALAHVKSEREANGVHVDINVGIVGLGAGTLAAYGQKGDKYDFYELNPDVKRLADDYFTYLKSSKAKIQVILGDGRVSLTRAVEQERYLDYDVLVIDAFSGDSIPSHLLTLEAFELYFQHLNDQGILAIHISNSHLDLTPLVRGLAQAFNQQAVYINTLEKQAGENNAQWVLITNSKNFLANASVRKFVSRWPLNAEKTMVWTDDYSNLLSVLK
jgi:hypothetical protein